jgi:hypothetical protein
MRVAIAAIRRRFIGEKPDKTLDSKNAKTAPVIIKVILLWVTTLAEK